MRTVTLKSGRVVQQDRVIADIQNFREVQRKVLDGDRLSPDERDLWNDWLHQDIPGILLDHIEELSAVAA